MKQEEYLFYVANRNYDSFLKQGFATPGNNGPHGHKDTPVRNTSHYLIIYSYLYKKTGEQKYSEIAKVFFEYLVAEQSKTLSGAIQCFEESKGDHINGLIGQAWVIEALVYYYEVFGVKRSLDVALKIYKSQRYDRKIHLWHRVELDGTDLGIDITYNHNVWFAACSQKLGELLNDSSVLNEVLDFLNYTKRDFVVSRNGLLSHIVNLQEAKKQNRMKRLIKALCFVFRPINRRKLDPHYIQYGYQIFDIYGFELLKLALPEHPLFVSKSFIKAERLACNLKWINRKNRVGKPDFNVYGYGYNSPAFELPFVLACCKIKDESAIDLAFKTNAELMYDEETLMFSRNNYDVDTWNARTYEIIRSLEVFQK